MSAADIKTAGPEVPAPRPPAGDGPAPSAPRRSRWTNGPLLPYLLIAPAAVALAAVFLWPLIKTVIMSFQDVGRRELWTGQAAEWVGLEQFTNILGESEFYDVLWRTVLFMVICVVATMAIGLFLAHSMQRMTKAVRLLLTGALIAAWSLPLLVATSIFRWFADSDYGVANMVLTEYLGLDFQGHNWFLDPKQGFIVIGAVVVWGAVPFVAVTLYAALTQVPAELEEAAELDGAGRMGVFRYVTWPVIKPVFQMVATLSVIWDFNVFGQVFLMRGNKPEPEYNLLGLYSYEKAFESNSFSQGAAIALITVLLLSGVAVYYLRQLIKIGDVE
ncbi:carbohydrate ABC transporter permease [Streptomyces sp. NPDC057148]|uniref:carbohydrate ABC transporter permease n=1 Tax=unclassified Streptomyces TaxID=2593676 RepID=UPI00363389E0